MEHKELCVLNISSILLIGSGGLNIGLANSVTDLITKYLYAAGLISILAGCVGMGLSIYWLFAKSNLQHSCEINEEEK